MTKDVKLRAFEEAGWHDPGFDRNPGNVQGEETQSAGQDMSNREDQPSSRAEERRSRSRGRICL